VPPRLGQINGAGKCFNTENTEGTEKEKPISFQSELSEVFIWVLPLSDFLCPLCVLCVKAFELVALSRRAEFQVTIVG
jgi:hypothetical protein